MGRKKPTQKQAATKPPSPLRDEWPEVQPPEEAQPTVPQPQPQTSTPQATQMVSLDDLTAYLKRANPNMDWEATLAGLGQLRGGAPVIPTPTPEIPPTVIPPTSVSTSSTPTPNDPSPKETAPSETSKPSPGQPQIEPLDVSPLSAYHYPETDDKEEAEGERPIEEEKTAEEKESEEGGEKTEETPVAETVIEGRSREEVDLNETAMKQGLMTDDEFKSIMDGVNMKEEETAEMAEGLDLASKVVGDSNASEPIRELEEVTPQSVAGVGDEQTEDMTPQSVAGVGDEQTKDVATQSVAGVDTEETEEKEPEVPVEKPEPVTHPVIKPKVVKRKLVLKDDPKVERQKPKYISQRCLGRGMSRKAGANTASDAVVISSEDEMTTPTKPEEESLSAANRSGTTYPN